MATSGGPNTTTEGLVFGYDTGYPMVENNQGTYKFNKGEPVEKLWDNMLNTQSLRTHTKHYWDGRKWIENATYSHPGVDGPKGIYLGLVFKHTSGALNSSWSGNSYGYMLRDIACTNGATMTTSCWVYASTDCDVTAIPAVIEQESSGESTVTGYNASYDLNNKGTWQIFAKKAISDGQVRFIPLYPRKEGVTDGSFAGFFMWALPQVTYGDHVVQPIQPGTTRSVSGSLLDLTRTTDINVSNVSFDSNAQMTFDGTDDYFTTSGLSIGTPSSVSFETVIKFDGTLDSNDRKVFHWDKTGTTNGVAQIRKGTNNGRLMYQHHDGSQWYTLSVDDVVTSDTYIHILVVHSSTTATMYKDGVQVGTATVGNLEYTNAGEILVGYRAASEYWKGDIPIFRVYNNALSAQEVKENYDAIKNRFNI